MLKIGNQQKHQEESAVYSSSGYIISDLIKIQDNMGVKIKSLMNAFQFISDQL